MAVNLIWRKGGRLQSDWKSRLYGATLPHNQRLDVTMYSVCFTNQMHTVNYT